MRPLQSLVILALAACSNQTAIVYEVEAELNVTSQARYALVEIRTPEGELASGQTYDLLESGFPIRGRIVPRGGDADRVVTLTAVALNAERRPLVTARFRTGFVAGRTTEVRLVLYDACIGFSCGDDFTCDVQSGSAQCRALPMPEADAGVVDARIDRPLMMDGQVCAPYVAPPPTESCPRAVRSCTLLADTRAQMERCLIAAPSPQACGNCFDSALFSCASAESDCSGEIGVMSCCRQRACRDLGRASCTDDVPWREQCQPEYRAASSCIREASRGACADAFELCFPPADSDGCDPLIPAPPPGGACAASVATCLETGAVEQCVADQNSPCFQCLNDEYWFCIGTRGCAEAFGNLNCCVVAQCPDVSDGACQARVRDPGGACAPQSDALEQCGHRVLDQGFCQDRQATNCFMP